MSERESGCGMLTVGVETLGDALDALSCLFRLPYSGRGMTVFELPSIVKAIERKNSP
ncbi:MAG: hypothetical protein RBJ76_07550 [Stenomitos frigidus ULC029]